MIINKVDQNVPYIIKNNFRLLFSKTKNNSYDQNIKQWIKSKKIISLKRGIYIFSSYWEKCQRRDDYLNFLSQVIYYPSYISKETILFKNQMISESVYGISCISMKAPKTFSSEIGIFQYSKIKPSLFLGFEKRSYIENKYYVATKAKALFDYLYFYKRKLVRINEKSIEELRLNFSEMNDHDWIEFESYLKIAKSLKLDKMYKIIRKIYAQ